MSVVTVDLQAHQGRVRPLHGVNNGPVGYGGLVDVSHFYRELGVPSVRLHDPNWPHPREVDIPQVFPDFSADPEDPASYDFGRTDDYLRRIFDTGATAVYRLGTSIEHTSTKYFTHPPADYEKWARICLGIIRHYSRGWADGMSGGVSYWEIWNEPETATMWSGTFAQYLDLYTVASRAIKDFAPDLRVGGFAAAYPQGELSKVGEFLDTCRDRDLPLDFFSWHTYSDRPEEIVQNARAMRQALDERGFTRTESHINEWNYICPHSGPLWEPGKEAVRREVFEHQKNEQGASFCASVLTLLQDERLDVANYYDGQPSALYCGLFDYYGVPQKTFRAFGFFRSLLDCGQRVRAEVQPAEATCALAAVGPGSANAAVMVSRFGGSDGPCSVRFSSAPAGARCRVQMIDRDRGGECVLEAPLDARERAVEFELQAYSVALVALVDAATAPDYTLG